MGAKTTKTAFFFKWLKPNRHTPHTFTKYPKPGHWTTRLKLPLRLCAHGYHLLRPREIFHFFNFRRALWLVEAETYGMVEGRNKVVSRRVRLIRRIELSKYEQEVLLYSRDSSRRWQRAVLEGSLRPGHGRSSFIDVARQIVRKAGCSPLF